MRMDECISFFSSLNKLSDMILISHHENFPSGNPNEILKILELLGVFNGCVILISHHDHDHDS